MVVSNSSKINRRAAQTNVARQELDRVNVLQEKTKADAASAQAKIAELRALPNENRPEDYNQQLEQLDKQVSLARTQTNNNSQLSQSISSRINNNISVPTNTLGLGYNAQGGTFNSDGTVKAKPPVSTDIIKANAYKQYIDRGGDPNTFEATWNSTIKPGISDVLNNSGKGTLQETLAAQKAEYDNTKGYRTVTTKDGGVRYVEDTGVTAQMKEALAKQNLATATAANTAQKTLDTNTKAQEQSGSQPTIDPLIIEQGNNEIDSMLAALPAEQQAVLNPLFQAMKSEFSAQLANGNNYLDAITTAKEKADSGFQIQKEFIENMYNKGSEMLETQKKADLIAEEEARDKALRDNEYARQIEESKNQKIIRDEVYNQEVRADSLLLQNGISGGWRASMKTAAVLKQIQRGEQAVLDLKNEAILHSREYANKALDIERDYTANVRSVNNKFMSDFMTLSNTILGKAIELDNNKTLSDNQFLLKSTEITNDIVSSYAKLQTEKAKSYSDALSNMYTAEANARKQLYQEQKDLLADTYKYIDVFGTSNTVELARRERELGLTAGTFSNRKTLAEIKRTGSVYGPSLGTIADDIDNMYNIAKDAVSDDKLAQDYVIDLMYQRYGTSTKGREQYFLAEKYINDKYGRTNKYYSTAIKQEKTDDTDLSKLTQQLLSSLPAE